MVSVQQKLVDFIKTNSGIFKVSGCRGMYGHHHA
jgi:hypothetical protein